MSFKIHSTAPDAFIRFFCYEKSKTSNGMTEPFKVRELIVRKDIISVSTNKPKSGMGSFQIQLGSAVNFKSYISQGDWCMIHISNHRLSTNETSELNGGLKMIGIVKSVKRMEQTDPATGTRTVRYQISGEDFHSVFNSQIYVNQALADPKGLDTRLIATAVLGKLVAQSQMTPNGLISNLIDAVIGVGAFDVDPKTGKTSGPSEKFRIGLPIKVPSELFKAVRGTSDSLFSKMIARHIQGNLIGKTTWMADVGEQISLWSLIQAYGNLILNECYTDLLPVHDGKTARLLPSFVMRAIPFSSKKLHESQIFFSKHNTKLLNSDDRKEREVQETKQDPGTGKSYYVSRQIFENEITGFESSKSDAERFNFFYITPRIIGDQKTDNAFFISNFSDLGEISDKVSQQRYGLKPFISASQYATENPSEDAKLATNICKDMWENAYLYENGVVQIIGTPNHIPVGTNIVFAERGWIAHVESVSHSFVVGTNGKKNYRTQIAFTRLQKTDGNPIDWSEQREANGQLGEWDRGYSEYTKTVGGKNLKKRIK